MRTLLSAEILDPNGNGYDSEENADGDDNGNEDAEIDLTGTFFDATPESTTAGSMINVDFTVANAGSVTAGSFDVDFYLSTDATISCADFFLGSQTITSLPGDSNIGVLSTSLQLPAPGTFWQGDGTYVVGMIVDGKAAIRETNEANNANRGDQLNSDALQVAGTIGAVTGFTLIDARREQPLFPLANNAVINLATLQTERLNVTADTVPMVVGSVVFTLDGQQARTENVEPYALFGNDGGEFFAGSFSLGVHTLTATPFSGSNGSGVAGTPRTITFTVIDVPPPPAMNLAGMLFDAEPDSTTAGSSDVDLYVSPDAANGVGIVAGGDATDTETKETNETNSGDGVDAINLSDTVLTDAPVTDSLLIDS